MVGFSSTSLGLKVGEGPRTARLFGFVFLLTAAAVLARSAQRELFLAAHPRSAIPDAFLASAAVLMVASLALAALAPRWTLVRVTRALLLTAVVSLAAGRVALAWFPKQAPMGLFVLIEVLMPLLMAQGWAVASEAVDVRSAKRLLPLVGFGAGLAWTLGGLGIGALATTLGPAAILAAAPGALLGAWVVLQAIATRDVREVVAPGSKDATGVRNPVLTGLKYLVNEPLMRALSIIITVELVLEKLTDFQLMASAQERFAGSSGGIASFMGLFYGLTSAFTLLTPVLSGWLLSRFGSARVLLAGQGTVFVGAVLFFCLPYFPVIVVLAGGDRLLKQAIGGSARSQLLGALPSVRRVQSGTLLRGVVAGAFTVLTAASLKALPASLPVHWLSVGVAALAAALWLYTRRRLRASYLLALHRSVDRSRLDLDGVVAKPELGREQVALLAEELESPDQFRAALALSLLGTADPALARPLLLQALGHGSADVRARSAALLGSAGDAGDAEPLGAALLAAREDEVRCACLRALAQLRVVGSLPAFAPHLDAANVRVRALARLGHAHLRDARGPRQFPSEGEPTEPTEPTEPGAAWAPFHAMLRSASDDEREAAAWAVGEVVPQAPMVRRAFAPLLSDPSPRVRSAAVRAAGQFDDQPIVRALVYALDEPATATAAFEAFAQLGNAGVARVEGVLRDAPVGIVSRTASALSRGPAQRATQVLAALLEHADGQVRYRASRALVTRRRLPAWQPPEAALIQRAIELELVQGYRYKAALEVLRRELEALNPLHRFVAGEVDARIQETERRLLALVAVVADPRLARLSHYLRDAGPQVEARVLELVEASLEQTLSAVVVPFLERSPQLVGSGPAPTSNERPGAGFTETSVAGDAVAVVLALGDDYLRLVATQALGPRFAQRLPTRGPQEEHVLQMVDRLRFLRSVPVFKHLSPEDLLKLAEIATLTEHAAGSYIFRKGDPGDVLCVVMRGRVEIRDQGQLIATQRQNDFFGELAIFDQEPRSADAVCVDDTELLEIGGADLESLMERRPEISREIIRVLAKRLRTTTQELVGKSRGVEASPAAAR